MRLSQLFRIHIDGFPLDLASRLLPWFSRLDFGLLSHIHLHARAQLHFAGRDVNARRGRLMGCEVLTILIGQLEGMVGKLEWKPEGTE